MKTILLRSVALGLLFAAPFAPAGAFAMSDAEKADIRTVVRDYLLENPEVLLEAMDALEVKRAAEDAKSQKQAIASVADQLTAAPAGAVLGNPDGDVTLVEFFDYNCGYCKRALPDVEALIAADPKLRVVLKEIPVLGEQSLAASRVSLAFRHVAPERYAAFYEKLLGLRAVADEDSALGIAEGLGVGEDRIRDAMKAPEVQAALDEDNRLAAMLKINGTPSYVIGDEVIAGAVGQAALAAKIENMRKCASASC